MQIAGRRLTEQDLERIRARVGAGSGMTRTALSRTVCEELDWRGANGRLKEMSCRIVLLKLERRGLIKLPPARSAPFWQTAVPDETERLEVPQIETTLAGLGEVWLDVVDRQDKTLSRQWWQMMNADHPLGGGALCGAQLRYFVVSRLGIIGGLSFSAPAWRLSARDGWIGWDDASRQAGLPQIINNSRFLIAPSVRVPHLASHVLGLALRQIAGDWQARYGVTPVLVESFTDPARHLGTCYRAANFIHVGQTTGRGRQDRKRTAKLAAKDIWLYPLARHWRQALGGRAQKLVAVQEAGPASWTDIEFGHCALGDRRLNQRLVTLAQDFYAQPCASLPRACGSRARTKAAYRFFSNKRTTMPTLLQPHYQATEARMAGLKVVLAPQDSTSLNYTAHPATSGLGPIGTTVNGPQGLHLHGTYAVTPDGTPLGLIDAQCWHRNPDEFGKKAKCQKLPIEQKESNKWLKSYRAAAKVQARLPETTVVSLGDREADLYDLFALAEDTKQGPMLLVRARHNRVVKAEQKLLWPTLEAQPVAGVQVLKVPRQHNRPAREAHLTVRFAKIELCAPQNDRQQDIVVWAVLAKEEEAPKGVKPLEWMLLSTLPVESFEQAIEKLQWYARRWTIEVLHRILKSGCRIEDRQLGQANRLEACLAIDLVVAWRIHHLNKLGRDTPDAPCTVYFDDDQWKALWAFTTKKPVPPKNTPSLRQAIHRVASLGGFLGRRGDGEPGTQTLWIGLQRLDDITTTWRVLVHGTHLPVSSTGYG